MADMHRGARIAVLCAMLAGCSFPSMTPVPLPATAESGGDARPPAEIEPAGAPDSYWVTNPTSGARLSVRLVAPNRGGQDVHGTLLLVPGGIGTYELGKARQLAREGFVVVIFDPDGRGQSEGVEDYGGFVQQDGLAAVARALASIEGFDAHRLGIVSFSYGITMAAGALARHADMPAAFLIDWEGPADRVYTTTGCPAEMTRIEWQPCSDESFWSQREAVAFIGQVRVPYLRLQSEHDHVQPTPAHAIDMVNAAVDGGVPWVRLNDGEVQARYDPAAPPAMLPDSLDRELETIVARSAVEILAMLGLGP